MPRKTTAIPLTPRFKVVKLDQWGKLVKSWATHLDYLGQPPPDGTADSDQPPRNYSVKGYPQPPPPAITALDIDAQGKPKPWALPPMNAVAVPRADGSVVSLPGAVALTVAEFQTLLAAAGVALDGAMPPQYQTVIVVQGSANTMLVRLPPKDILQGSEDDLINHALPYPMKDYYDKYYGGAKPVPPTTRADIMELHAYRIGDYTMSNCD